MRHRTAAAKHLASRAWRNSYIANLFAHIVASHHSSLYPRAGEYTKLYSLTRACNSFLMRSAGSYLCAAAEGGRCCVTPDTGRLKGA